MKSDKTESLDPEPGIFRRTYEKGKEKDYQMEELLLQCLCAAVVAYILTFVCRKTAPVLGLMDIPKDGRRMHSEPIPRMGGIAIYLSFVIIMGAFGDFLKVLPFAVGGLVLVVIGVLDDKHGVKPWVKILGQIISGAVLCVFGISARYFSFFGKTLDVGEIAGYILTVIWVVAVTNIFNLIDGLDGLCSGITLIAAIGIVFNVVIAGGDMSTVTVTAVFAAAVLGFLPHNACPAKIFLGDTGAMLCGYMLASLSCMVFYSDSARTLGALTPLLLFGIPVFDTSFAIIRRLASGSGVFCGDKKHVHHRLSKRYGSVIAVVLMHLFSVVLAAASIIINSSLTGEIIGYVIFVCAVIYGVLRFGICKH